MNTVGSDQAALPEITKIVAGGALHQIDREFEEADFPRVIDPVNDRAERFVFALDLAPGAINH